MASPVEAAVLLEEPALQAASALAVTPLIAAAAAFELVLGRLRGSLAAGVKAALAIYDQVLAALLPDQAGGPQAGAAELADAQLELLSPPPGKAQGLEVRLVFTTLTEEALAAAPQPLT